MNTQKATAHYKNASVVPITSSHRNLYCGHLAPQLAPSDIRELQALSPGRSPFQVLYRGCRQSSPAFAVIIKGECVGMFGVVPDASRNEAGNVWLLGSPRLNSLGRLFAKKAKKIWLPLLKLHTHNGVRYKCLHNVVGTFNKTHVRWIEWLGFTIDPKVRTINKEPFQYFYHV